MLGEASVRLLDAIAQCELAAQERFLHSLGTKGVLNLRAAAKVGKALAEHLPAATLACCPTPSAPAWSARVASFLSCAASLPYCTKLVIQATERPIKKPGGAAFLAEAFHATSSPHAAHRDLALPQVTSLTLVLDAEGDDAGESAGLRLQPRLAARLVRLFPRLQHLALLGGLWRPALFDDEKAAVRSAFAALAPDRLPGLRSLELAWQLGPVGRPGGPLTQLTALEALAVHGGQLDPVAVLKVLPGLRSLTLIGGSSAYRCTDAAAGQQPQPQLQLQPPARAPIGGMRVGQGAASGGGSSPHAPAPEPRAVPPPPPSPPPLSGGLQALTLRDHTLKFPGLAPVLEPGRGAPPRAGAGAAHPAGSNASRVPSGGVSLHVVELSLDLGSRWLRAVGPRLGPRELSELAAGLRLGLGLGPALQAHAEASHGRQAAVARPQGV